MELKICNSIQAVNGIYMAYKYIREQERKVVHLNYICEYKKLIKFFGATLVVELSLSEFIEFISHTSSICKKNLSAYLYHLPIYIFYS